MREFLDRMFRLTLAMPFIALRQFMNLLSPASMSGAPEYGGDGGYGADVPQLTGTTLQTGGTPQVRSVDAPDGGIASTINLNIQTPADLPSSNVGRVNSGNLNTSRMVVLGEGLAAGVGDFSLSAETQPWSFPALMARQCLWTSPKDWYRRQALET